MIFKLWIWMIEFRVRRVSDDKKLLVLTEMLINELKNQGNDIYSTVGDPGRPYFSVSEHENTRSIYGHKFNILLKKGAA